MQKKNQKSTISGIFILLKKVIVNLLPFLTFFSNSSLMCLLFYLHEEFAISCMVLLLDWKKMYITFNIFSEYKYTEDPRIEWTFVYEILSFIWNHTTVWTVILCTNFTVKSNETSMVISILFSESVQFEDPLYFKSVGHRGCYWINNDKSKNENDTEVFQNIEFPWCVGHLSTLLKIYM